MKIDSSGLVRATRIARIVGMIVGSALGSLYGVLLVAQIRGPLGVNPGIVLPVMIGLGLGCLVGYLVGPTLSIRPYRWAEAVLIATALPELLGATAGVLVALVIAALLALAFAGLPYHLGWIVPVVALGMLIPLGISVGRHRRREISALTGPIESEGVEPPAAPPEVLVDTSAIIDGRLLDLARAGFCLYRLLVPHFVLEELQGVADAGDPQRRARGRRGLAVLEEVRTLRGVRVEFPTDDYPSIPEVDARLVRAATDRHAAIMTVDYNLDRLAQIAGVRVLNLNQLAVALKPIFVAGEVATVEVQKEGRELEQGIAYLDDGTLVVVENGRTHVGRRVAIVVRSVIQTATGRMVFAQVAPDQSPAPPQRRRARRAGDQGSTPPRGAARP